MNLRLIRNQPRRAAWLVLGVLACLPPAAKAQLEFVDREKIAFADPDLDRLVIEFPFRNAGTSAVHIKAIRPECGCTVVSLAKRAYAPQESGVLRVVFNYADLVGVQKKTVQVETDSSENAVIPLSFEVVVPDRITIKPRLLRWKYREPASSQVVELQVREGDAAKPTSVSVEPSGVFTAELRVVEQASGGRYEVVVRVLDTSRPAQAMLKIHTEPGIGRAHRLRVPLVVR